jgi:hypothetical protein
LCRSRQLLYCTDCHGEYKITIIPHGHAALGYTMQIPTDDPSWIESLPQCSNEKLSTNLRSIACSRRKNQGLGANRIAFPSPQRPTESPPWTTPVPSYERRFTIWEGFTPYRKCDGSAFMSKTEPMKSGDAWAIPQCCARLILGAIALPIIWSGFAVFSVVAFCSDHLNHDPSMDRCFGRRRGPRSR